MTGLRVVKFGGTSVANGLPEVVRRIRESRRLGPTVVVVSAFAGLTDRLTRLRCRRRGKRLCGHGIDVRWHVAISPKAVQQRARQQHESEWCVFDEVASEESTRLLPDPVHPFETTVLHPARSALNFSGEETEADSDADPPGGG